MNNKNIAIAGSHGFIGTHLVKKFEKNNRVIRINRKTLYNHQELLEILKEVDVVINVAGVPIYKLWTKRNKRKIYNSRILPARNIVKALNEIGEKSVFYLNSSAIGVYDSEKCYDEVNAAFSDNFLATVIKDWEKEIHNLHKNHKFAITRLGIVLGEGGYFEKVLPAFKLKTKVTFGSGKQYFSYVHIDDVVNCMTNIVENHWEGIYNVTNGDVIRVNDLNNTIAGFYNTWISLKIPVWIVKMIVGEQHVVFTEGQCVVPKKLLDKGVKFQFENTIEVLNSVKRKKS